MPIAHPSTLAGSKEVARRLLARFDLDGVSAWARAEPRAARALQSLLFDEDDLVSWRAVEALGRVAAVLASDGLEPARELVRRTLWLMNDESGGLLWQGPPVLGAVLANVPRLCDEFGGVLASFLEEEPFRAGTRWALWRLAGVRPDVVAAAAGALAASRIDADPAVRGLAALALLAARAGDPTALARDGAEFVLFDFRTGALCTASVGEAVPCDPRLSFPSP